MAFTASPHHVGLSVADLEAEERWYRLSLGLTEVVERVELPEPAVRTVVLRAPSGLRLELIELAGSTPSSADNPLEAARTQTYGHLALEVDDLDAAFSELTAAGAHPVSPPAPGASPGTRFAYVQDPEGNLLELIQS
ncbi:MAG TPA: VOC family protein [Solirubrobacteraceae bacterium]|jgi:catechol 2,3-dioxygenase-like lactoylglutathione lyase family enzyme|nr:VOC family protein [Solirubrobacteraceae bacterium]